MNYHYLRDPLDNLPAIIQSKQHKANATSCCSLVRPGRSKELKSQRSAHWHKTLAGTCIARNESWLFDSPKMLAVVKEMNPLSTHPPPGTWNARNLLTVLEIAEWARVHPKTVYHWIKEGKLEFIQFGPRTFRVPEDAIGKFLQKTGYSKTTELPKTSGREQ